MSKRQLIEALLDAHEQAITAGDAKECARQFLVWLDRVALALESIGMAEESKRWKEAQATVRFCDDDSSFPAQSESMKAILIGMLARLDQSEPFVNVDRLNELRAIKSNRFDLAKLIALCEELNTCYANDCLFAVAFLVRAIPDHVPPILGHKSFTEVCNNYPGGKSFKETMAYLEPVMHFHA